MCRKIEIDAAWTARHGGTYRPRKTDTDIPRMVDPICSLGIGLGRIHLVELFIITLLQIDDRAVARSADQDHRKAVGGRISECHHSVEKSGRRDGEANARLLGQV